MANKRENIKFDNQIQSIKKGQYRKLGNVQYGSVRDGTDSRYIKLFIE